MKRVLSLVLVLAMIVLAAPVSAFAAGKLTITKENMLSTDGWSTYSYVYARVENTGDKPVEYNSGLFEVYDSNGDVLKSETYLTACGAVLQPGEYMYVYDSMFLDSSVKADDVDDYLLSVSGKSATKTTRRFSCESTWQPNVRVSEYWSRNYMAAVFTNDTDDVLYNLTFTFALLDASDNILYVENKGLYDSVGIMPGSSVVVRIEPNSSILDVYKEAGITPTHVDAYVYVND